MATMHRRACYYRHEMYSLNRIPIRYWIFMIAISLFINIFILFHSIYETIPLRSTPKFNLNYQDPRVLVDLTDFEYLIRDPIFEKRTDRINNPYFVIIVSSKPSNEEMRQTIRHTWAHADDRVETYFALGAVQSKDLQQKIGLENDEYNDIIQGNFIDSSYNATYKHVMALKWFKDAYENVKYLVKVDEDVFPNVINIYNFLSNYEIDRNLLMSIYHELERCPRNGMKSISLDDYSSDYFPNYAESSCVIYSTDVVRDLYEKSCNSKFFRMDDVFVTGMLRYQLNLSVTPIDKYILPAKYLKKMENSSIVLAKPFNFMFSSKPILMRQQRFLWDRTEWNRIGSTAQQTELGEEPESELKAESEAEPNAEPNADLENGDKPEFAAKPGSEAKQDKNEPDE